MIIEDFIRNILKTIEDIYPGVIAYAYRDGNSSGTHRWWKVCVSDYSVYMYDERFRRLTEAWRTAGKVQDQQIVFCYCNTSEEILTTLLDKELMLNI